MNGSVEFETADRHFLIHPLPPVVQFHIMRKFAKVTSALARTNTDDPVTDADMIEGDDGERIVSPNIIMNRIMAAFGELSEDEVDFILSKCLSRVQMQNGDKGTWANIWGAGGLMFSDLTYQTLLVLTMQVIQENVGPFSNGQGIQT